MSLRADQLYFRTASASWLDRQSLKQLSKHCQSGPAEFDIRSSPHPAYMIRHVVILIDLVLLEPTRARRHIDVEPTRTLEG